MIIKKTIYFYLGYIQVFLENAQDEGNEESRGVRGSLTSGLVESIEARFDDILSHRDHNALLSTLLDPHYKDLYFTTQELGTIKQHALHMLSSCKDDTSSPPPPSPP